MAERTIVIHGNGRRSERLSTAVAIQPGILLEQVAGAETVQAQSVAEAAGTYPEKMFAMENSLVGGEVGTAYAASSRIQIYHAQSGDVIYAMIEDGENIAIGDLLTANGTNGTLKERDTATNPPIAVAIEALDLSGSANTADGLCKVRII